MKIDYEFEYMGLVIKDSFTLPDTISFTEAQIEDFRQKAIADFIFAKENPLVDAPTDVAPENVSEA